MSMLFKMALFGVLGLGMEVIFTALLDRAKDSRRHLIGFSSLWYFPLYMIAPLYLSIAAPALFALRWPVRGLIYMVSFFVFEYVGMWSIRKLVGSSPSEANYRKARWNVHGLIRLDFAPAWFSAGLLIEGLYRRLP
jgi:hypothetical protein